MKDDTSRRFQFAAIDPFLESHIVRPTEKVNSRGSYEYVMWGDDNDYPDYLLSLYEESTTLHSVIDGVVDFISGDDVRCNVVGFDKELNKQGLTPREAVKKLARSAVHFGGLAAQIVSNKAGNGVAEIYPQDIRYLRTTKEREAFFYSEKWTAKRRNTVDVNIYPRFRRDFAQPSAIHYVTDTDFSVYPVAKYAAAVKACEMERSIDEMHLNAVNNQFMSDTLVNLCNGIPTDEEKKEIEDTMTEKFSGKENAGRIMLNFAPTKDNAAFVEHLTVEDWGVKYESLAKWCRQQIFTAFRANPNLFGIPTESLGFSSEEYESAFLLFNRTFVQPYQRMIKEFFAYIFGVEDAITILPFTLDGYGEGAI